MGILFLYSAIAKALSMKSLETTVRHILPVSLRIHRPTAAIVVTLETITGIALLAGSWWAKVTAIVLLGMFAVVAQVVVNSGQRVSCNCFGTGSSEYFSTATVVRNIALALMMAATLRAPDREATVMTFVYALIVFALFMTLSRMVSNHREFLVLLKGNGT